MIHIALQAMRIHCPDMPYTAPGLGDRIHSVTLGWAYANHHGEDVTLHLTADKLTGGQFGNKPESWQEILSLFPGGVHLQYHDFSPKSEAEWLKYLSKYNPLTYHYADSFIGNGFDASKYLADFPLIDPDPVDFLFPERFITAQFDASGQSRRAKNIPAILAKYDCDALAIGGEAVGPLKTSLKHIAAALSKAQCHVGVDSAFMHMAQLYLPMDRIHLCAGENRSHHLTRALKNGARLIQ